MRPTFCKVSVGPILSGGQEAGRDGVGQLVGPGLAAEIVEPGVAEAGVRIVLQQIGARQAALRELIPAGEGHAVLSGAKLVEVDHLAPAYPGWQKVPPGGSQPSAAALPLWGPFKQTVGQPPKTLAEFSPNCNSPGGRASGPTTETRPGTTAPLNARLFSTD